MQGRAVVSLLFPAVSHSEMEQSFVHFDALSTIVTTFRLPRLFISGEHGRPRQALTLIGSDFALAFVKGEIQFAVTLLRFVLYPAKNLTFRERASNARRGGVRMQRRAIPLCQGQLKQRLEHHKRIPRLRNAISSLVIMPFNRNRTIFVHPE